MLPPCKYGSKCYRKNRDHLAKFTHEKEAHSSLAVDDDQHKANEPEPKKIKIQDDVVEKDDKEEESDSASGSDDDATEDEIITVPNIASDSECDKFCQASFLCPMPKDFYHFWNFIKDLQTKTGSETLLKVLKTELVGPFHVISNKLRGKQFTKGDLLCYYRFVTDPPEMQTVMITHKYRFGYWRDNFDWGTHPIMVQVENDVEHFPKFKIVGDNLFAAFKTIVDDFNGDEDDEEYSVIDGLFAEHCNKHMYCMEPFSDTVKQRKRSVVAPTIHSVGIVVPVQNDVGYRPLGENNAWFKKTLTTMGTTKDEAIRESLLEKLQETSTYVQFANDEMDYGMGLEFAHDLLVSGYREVSRLLNSLLPTAYMLLNAPGLQAIATAHFKRRFDEKHLSHLKCDF